MIYSIGLICFYHHKHLDRSQIGNVSIFNCDWLVDLSKGLIWRNDQQVFLIFTAGKSKFVMFQMDC